MLPILPSQWNTSHLKKTIIANFYNFLFLTRYILKGGVFLLSVNGQKGERPMMSRKSFVVFAIFILSVAFTNDVFSTTYDIIKLADTNSSWSIPIINNQGNVVWSDSNGLYQYSRASGVQTLISGNTIIHPYINDKGQIAYVRLVNNDINNRELYLREAAGNTTLITRGTDISIPNLNNLGHMVWTQNHNTNNDGPIYFYNGSIITQLTNSADDYPKINDSGQVVFERYFDHIIDRQIMLYDNGNITQLTSASRNDIPDINNSGNIAYRHNVRDIIFYDGNEQTIGTGTNSSLNNNNHIAFVSNGNILLYDGNLLTSLTDKAVFNLPDINDSDFITFRGYEDGKTSIYLASPVPTPGSLLLLLSGLGGICLVGRRSMRR